MVSNCQLGRVASGIGAARIDDDRNGLVGVEACTDLQLRGLSIHGLGTFLLCKASFVGKDEMTVGNSPLTHTLRINQSLQIIQHKWNIAIQIAISLSRFYISLHTHI